MGIIIMPKCLILCHFDIIFIKELILNKSQWVQTNIQITRIK